jgi:hypothetical protein
VCHNQQLNKHNKRNILVGASFCSLHTRFFSSHFSFSRQSCDTIVFFIFYLFACPRKKEKRNSQTQEREREREREREKSAKQNGKQLGKGQVCARCTMRYMSTWTCTCMRVCSLRCGAGMIRAEHLHVQSKSYTKKKTSYKRERYAGEHPR